MLPAVTEAQIIGRLLKESPILIASLTFPPALENKIWLHHVHQFAANCLSVVQCLPDNGCQSCCFFLENSCMLLLERDLIRVTQRMKGVC